MGTTVHSTPKERFGRVNSFGPQHMKTPKSLFGYVGDAQSKHGGRSTNWHVMPLTYNLQVELFDVWGINIMGLFLKSYGSEYIMMAFDYLSEWV